MDPKYTYIPREDKHICVMQVVSGSFITLTVTSDKITDIQFEGRPRATPSVQHRSQMFRSADANNEFEDCHRIGLTILKKEICNKYVDRKIDSFAITRGLNPNMQKDVTSVCELIKQDWRITACNTPNIFRGNKQHNNFSGKLTMLLKPYFDKGEASFNQEKSKNGDGTFEIPIPILSFQGDRDFYSIVRTELKTDRIILNSWEELCEWYFAANFDESQGPQIHPAMRMSFSPATIAGQDRIKAQQAAQYLQDGICRFKRAFNLSTLYQPVSNASTSQQEQTNTKRRKIGEECEEPTSTNTADTSQLKK